jgi:hypothetical protein
MFVLIHYVLQIEAFTLSAVVSVIKMHQERVNYEVYPESKFRCAIKKKTRIYYKPCILPFDVHTVHYVST